MALYADWSATSFSSSAAFTVRLCHCTSSTAGEFYALFLQHASESDPQRLYRLSPPYSVYNKWPSGTLIVTTILSPEVSSLPFNGLG